jgi:hypothetical protein
MELASKCVILAMPDFPARILCQVAGIPIPTGETIPSPVMTTLRFDKMTPPNRKENGKDGQTENYVSGINMDYF